MEPISPFHDPQSQGPHSIRASSTDAWKEARTTASLLSPRAMPQAAGFNQPMSEELSPKWAEDDRRGREEEAPGGWALYKQEVSRVLRLAVPLSVTNLCGFFSVVISIAFVGRLGELQLSVAILAASIFNVTGFSVLIGFSAAMETFCGQAFGAGSYLAVGIVLQRAVILTSFLVLAVAGLWSQADTLLELLGQDASISKGAARYLHLVTPALYCAGLVEVFNRYLMVQGDVRPTFFVTLLALLLSPIYNWLLIYKLGWGLDGAALAADAIQGTRAVALGAYVAVRDYRRRAHPLNTWGGWTLQALTGWGVYLRFALPSVAMICCEWWASEAVIIMSGLLPDPDISIASMGITLNLSAIMYMLVLGLAMATSVRVSNLLGAGSPRSARRAMLTALGLTVCLEAACITVLMVAHKWLPYLFTDIPKVVALTAALLPIFVLSLPGEAINGVLQGLLRGAGKQDLGAMTNICSYWLFGIPLAATFAFKLHLGVQGLWWGLVAVVTVQSTVMLTIAMKFDFERQAQLAVGRFQQQRPSPVEPLLGEEICSPLLEQDAQAALNGSSSQEFLGQA